MHNGSPVGPMNFIPQQMTHVKTERDNIVINTNQGVNTFSQTENITQHNMGTSMYKISNDSV